MLQARAGKQKGVGVVEIHRDDIVTGVRLESARIVTSGFHAKASVDAEATEGECVHRVASVDAFVHLEIALEVRGDLRIEGELTLIGIVVRENVRRLRLRTRLVLTEVVVVPLTTIGKESA